METTYIVLIALTIIYIPLFLYVKFGKKLEEKGLVPYGPCIMIRTKVGLKLIDRLGRYKRVWRVMGIISRIITILLMIYIVTIIIIDLILIPSAIGKGGMGIEYALAIPGLNPMLPIVYGWIALILAMVVHELAHGIQSRANDITVDSTGLLYAVVPVGAFVEPNEEEIEKSSRGAKMDLYAAGITTNFIVAMITFILMFSMASATMESDYEDNPAIYGFTSNSPMMEYDIPTTSIILRIGTADVATIDDVYIYLDGTTHGFGAYDVTYLYKGTETTVNNARLGTFINGVMKNSPASTTGMESGDFIVELNGQKIGAPASFTDFMSGTTPGSELTIKYFDSSKELPIENPDAYVTETVTLTNNNGKGYLGVTTTLSGMSLTTPEIIMNNGIDPYYGQTTFTGYINGTIGYLAKAFNGFSPVPESTHWWYHSTFTSDTAMWIIIQLLYWIFWLNIVLGVTNALPAVPFDGGFLFMGGVDYITEKFVKDEKKKERIVDTICTGTTYFMLFALILVLFVIIV